jgi:hypothetical protein
MAAQMTTPKKTNSRSFPEENRAIRFDEIMVERK